MSDNELLQNMTLGESAQCLLDAVNDHVHNIKMLADGEADEFDDPGLAVEQIRLQVAVLEVFLDRLRKAVDVLGDAYEDA